MGLLGSTACVRTSRFDHGKQGQAAGRTRPPTQQQFWIPQYFLVNSCHLPGETRQSCFADVRRDNVNSFGWQLFVLSHARCYLLHIHPKPSQIFVPHRSDEARDRLMKGEGLRARHLEPTWAVGCTWPPLLFAARFACMYVCTHALVRACMSIRNTCTLHVFAGVQIPTLRDGPALDEQGL